MDGATDYTDDMDGATDYTDDTDGATDDTDDTDGATDDTDDTDGATDARIEPRITWMCGGGALFVNAGEGVALAGVAGVEAFFEPVHSLFGGSVCECVGNYIALALFL
jgi:hypothetical protein